jgi:hypothetical protein
VTGSALDWALAYASAGWPVFPLAPGSKIPFEGTSGVDDATLDPDLIRRLWEVMPDANLAIACGACTVLDLDMKDGKDGAAALQRLAAPHGGLPAGIPIARTPSGGLHLFFAGAAIRNRVGLGDKNSGIDVRAHGGYVAAAPSTLPNGAYEWVNLPSGPLPELPAWLVGMIGQPNARPEPGPRAERDPERPPASPEVLAAARKALAKHGPAVEGRGGDEHTYKAGAILLRDFALDLDEAMPLALEWNATCVPPWDPDDLERKLGNAGNYGLNAGNKRATVELADVIRKNLEPRTRVAQETPVETTDPKPERAPGDPEPAEDDRPNVARVKTKIPRETLLCVLRRDDHERVKPCGLNASLLIRHLFHAQFRFNLLEKTVDASRSLFKHETPDTLPKAVADFLAGDPEIMVDLPVSAVIDALLLVSMEHAFNPLRDYLLGLVWDGVPRLDTWLETYAAARTTDDEGSDITAYVRAVGSRWMVAAAARALYPGCKADTVLVLEGGQGFGKSGVFDRLGGQWFADTPLRIGDKDANLGAGSNWIIELAELASLKKAESESQKAFLSARVDKFRVPYGKAQQAFPRACIFGGTTNETGEYMVDRTGNRRYWCVRVDRQADLNALQRDRDQLWAEAVARLAKTSQPELARGVTHPNHEQGPDGERWWFERHEQDQADKILSDRMAEDAPDAYGEAIGKYVLQAGKKLAAGTTLAAIATDALQIPVERVNRRTLCDVAKAMRDLGWKPRGEARPRLWFRETSTQPRK